ncbi:MAG TPA: alpha/beta hydrolase [Pyrinomonadaceae bacterium]|nr:alpha/beta hydrolase [Pyrinomonadaceae bacterium]
MNRAKSRAATVSIFPAALVALLIFFGATSVAAQQAPKPVDHEATIYGQKIHYVEAGSGPVVILLHGLGGNTTNWALNIAPLAQKFRVIVPDQLGFGASSRPFINYRVGTYVDFLDGLYKELRIERASLVGNSMGGWIAVAYALAHPEKVERLVLIDAAGYALPANIDASTLSALNPSTREDMRKLASLVFYNKQFTTDAAVDFMLTERMTASDGYTIQSLIESIKRHEDLLDNRLAAIKQPTLIIWGRSDGLLPLAEWGERFHREIQGSQLLVIEQAGHVPQVEQAVQFNAAVIKFLTASTN